MAEAPVERQCDISAKMQRSDNPTLSHPFPGDISESAISAFADSVSFVGNDYRFKARVIVGRSGPLGEKYK